ncbi:MAG TPA: helix-turn-helix transcriptional regulator [Solirubrobacteraceae bacterium]|nr:helix-turn-helix transcriptional regulator [Solirubrobacteraceae bacterium]
MNSTEAVPDPLVLAAIDRAERHNPARLPGVPLWGVYDHLSIAKRSGPARHVRARLDALEKTGSIVRSRRHGIPTWALTSTGRRRLTLASRSGKVPELPESPQHRAWRNAKTAAAQEIDRFLHGVREGVDEAMRLLDADPAAISDAWFELGERLKRDCWRVASATHCLREWSEPDDARADVDDHSDPADKRFDPDERLKRRARRAGRRNIGLWDMPDSEGEVMTEHERMLLELGRTVRHLRTERHMSEDELAGAAGLTPGRLDAIEAGRYDPPWDVLFALADALGVKASALVKDALAETNDGDA